MNQLYFIIGFMTAVLGFGLFIFFWWRRTYGVWARQRKEREAARGDGATVIGFEENRSNRGN